MKFKSQHRLAKTYRVGIFSFILAILLLQVVYFLLPNFYEPKLVLVDLPDRVPEKQESFRNDFVLTQSFNPNHYTIEDWKKLHLSDKQIETLFNYKKAIGGFQSKEDFKKCYAISDQLYEKLEPYIDLPQYFSENAKKNYTKNYNSYQDYKKVNYTTFDPNTYNINDWMNIGFSEKQAQSILNYKNNYLKGNFTEVEQLSKCFVISEEKYNEIKPYVKIKSIQKNEVAQNDLHTEENTPQKNIELKPFNANDLDSKGWEALGFSSKQVGTILKFKKLCGGKFHSIEEFGKCYVVSQDKLEELRPYIRFE